ncbi:O-linked N-acetylglucosamine transferase, SPINDLY family protein [Plastoroseomonas arctica]|uniref:protein O-GlcNAc transferase n=1 Tax=Plastoroseomonas arctica TaxID=1509237 RepID=A0AAF1JXB6_9PROT|nr:tetratricopeptide repeat protein [Plastoroseomonas arctica]MBR0656047.1 tetratricopeptide repeat protein [Plastoroseomonas arctica]
MTDLATAFAQLKARRYAEALPLFDALIATGQSDAGPYRGRARCLNGLGRPEEALDALRAALPLAPEDPYLRDDLVETLVAAKDWDAAEPHILALCRLAPDKPGPYRRLAALHSRRNRPDFAVTAFEDAIARGDTRGATRSDLGNVLVELGRPMEAIARFEEAAPLVAPEYQAAVGVNLANACNLAGDVARASATIERVLADPDAPLDAHHARIFGLHYRPELTVDAYLQAHRVYGARVTAGAGNPPRPPRRDRAKGDPRLRIGYLSGDFRAHPVGYFIEGVLAAHDRGVVAPFAYANQHVADGTTRRIAAHVEALVPVIRLDDAALAARIRADTIDILVDLSGHTAANRLRVLTQRPAPILATWLGYAGPSGLPAMDWIIADAIALPLEDEALYTERALRLPGCYLSFRPPDITLARGQAPMLAGGTPRFGCFANLAKLNDAVLRAWARILAALPGSTLELRTRALGEPATAAALAARFAAQGGDPARLRCAPTLARGEYLARYAGIDLMLDPFPFPGGTTTAEALWAGTPVLVMRGRFGMMSRNGETLLSAAGIPDAIAADAEDYVARAIALGRDAGAMQRLRARIDTTRLTDADSFTRHLEDGFRRMAAETPIV